MNDRNGRPCVCVYLGARSTSAELGIIYARKEKKKKESKPSRRAHKRNLNKKSTLLKVKFMYQNRMPE
jgi:hypothetical protein